MQDFEKLGSFYLGRLVDPTAGTATDSLLLYDAKDLTRILHQCGGRSETGTARLL